MVFFAVQTLVFSLHFLQITGHTSMTHIILFKYQSISTVKMLVQDVLVLLLCLTSKSP